jgi:DNA-binding transcriptional MocR family regulator
MPRVSSAHEVSQDKPRYALERHIRDTARIPPLAKLVMYDLLSRLPVGTLDLGPKYSPKMDRLATATGMNRHTVEKYLTLLAEHGWLTARKRSGCKTLYVLSHGKDFSDKGRVSNLPGSKTMAQLSHGGVAGLSHGSEAQLSHAYRPLTVEKTDQAEDQDRLLEEDKSKGQEQGQRPAKHRIDPRTMAQLSHGPLDVEALLDGMDLELFS